MGRLVRATEHHDTNDDDLDGRVLLDADLAVLGSEPAAYQAYVTGVRTEYGHVDEARWRAGRAAVLRGLLDRRPLYATVEARNRWEARARANMTAELAALDGARRRRLAAAARPAPHPERDRRGGRPGGRRDGACERSDSSDDGDQHGSECTDVRPCIQRD